MGFIDIHTHHESIESDVISILHCSPDRPSLERYFSVGIHPWFIKKEQIETELVQLEHVLNHNHCLAIGECGLDKVTDVDFHLQNKVFESQIALSEHYQKPMIIHCVRAYAELIAMRKKHQAKQAWIVHGFRKSSQLARELLDHGIFLSFGAPLLNNRQLQRVVGDLPFHYFFLETDDQAIAIQAIYEQVAKLKKLTLTDVQEQISDNFKKIFMK